MTPRPRQRVAWRDRLILHSHVSKNGCWEWLRSLRNGYAQTGNALEPAGHRLSWTLFHGPVPRGLWVLHRCDNRKCINPDHLFVGVREDNIVDAVKKARYQRGSGHVCAKLTEADIPTIRELAESVSLTEIGQMYGVTYATIHDVMTRKTWQYVD